MNTAFDARQAYIHNITSLWETASIPFDAYVAYPSFSYCAINGIDWPNRLWFHQDITAEALDQAFATIPLIRKLRIPWWGAYGSNSWKILESKGYVNLTGATGMSLVLTTPFEQGNQLQYKPVENISDAILWNDLFFQAFGYRLHEKILMHTLAQMNYYVVYFENQPVGTGKLYITGTVAGIHSIGVIPAMRRKGFANEIMRFVLNQAIERNCTHAVLHASHMGKDLYIKLGFKDEFPIKNYSLPATAS
jgi:ribosomal protein S18 acetylase RimI-like enzyme